MQEMQVKSFEREANYWRSSQPIYDCMIHQESSLKRWWMLRAGYLCALSCWLPKSNGISTDTNQ